MSRGLYRRVSRSSVSATSQRFILRGLDMMGRIKAMGAATAVTLFLAWPASAGASVKWVCDVPGEGSVTFVSVPDAARHGIDMANAHAGQTFNRQFGEVCTVVQG
jgi:hypothetical protein